MSNLQLSGQQLLDNYRLMYRMRRFEEEAAKAYTERKIAGFLHLYIGQEAVASGVLAATQSQDQIITAYRCHAHYLARGGNSRAGMAELFGKETGCAKGRGGSMHFYNVKDGFLGGWGIVGAHIPIATGLAFAAKYQKKDFVAVCFLGDGAVSIGPFHEGLCLAALWRLPVVFVIENNGYAMGTPTYRSLVTEDASVRALGYPMARATVECTDINEVYRSAKEAIDRARNESLPTLLEYKTYRYRGHSMADPGKYRTKEEVESWKSRDPISICERYLQRDHADLASQIPNIIKEVEDEVLDAVRFAHESPDPVISEVGKYTYSDDNFLNSQSRYAFNS